MDLVRYLFHERQEPGSQLCAQHCLNNLLQQPVYTEIDLAGLAQKLDQAEDAMHSRAPGSKSYNYDDTGFFSISVLEMALQVWDLTLVRWRGEAMKPYQNRPEEQSAFILNLASHWFTLRRFGPLTRWYNLNSFLEQPEWVSPTFLDMVLKQAEAEGYSVFVVRRAGEGTAAGNPGEAQGWQDGGVAILPDSGAEMMALELGEVQGRHGAGGMDVPSVPAQAGPSGTTPDVDDLGETPAGSGRRRRRQADPAPMYEEEDSSQPSNRQRAGPGPSRDIVGADDMDAHAAMMQGLADADEELDEELDVDHAGAPSAPMPGFEGMYGGPTDFAYHNRSYDDEDEALQAALKASMEDLPPGFVLPPLEPKVPPPAKTKTTPPAPVSPQPEPVAAPAPVATVQEKADDIAEDDDDAPAEELSPEAIRRARLARFQALERAAAPNPEGES